jgi:6-phosphogluconolactonase
LVFSVAERIAELTKAIQKSKGYFAIALSGGSTPKPLYEALATPPLSYKIPWNYGYFFLVDERCVPETNNESNFKMIFESMLSKVPLMETNMFPVHFQDVDPERAATDYEERITEAFKLAPGAFPVFDIVLLGLGDDGHTASLFPGSDALKETSRTVVANYVDKFSHHRITLTPPVINNASHVYFLVSGQSKAEIVADVLCGKQSYPANLIHPTTGELEWYLDKEAASLLNPAACHSGDGS